jgi:hypothetical protein
MGAREELEKERALTGGPG